MIRKSDFCRWLRCSEGRRIRASLESVPCPKRPPAGQIVQAGADYCVAVKGNQPTLYQGIVDFFQDHLTDHFARTPVRRFKTREQRHERRLVCVRSAKSPRRSCGSIPRRGPRISRRGRQPTELLRERRRWFDAADCQNARQSPERIFHGSHPSQTCRGRYPDRRCEHELARLNEAGTKGPSWSVFPRCDSSLGSFVVGLPRNSNQRAAPFGNKGCA